MSPIETPPPWERIRADEDFREHLHELSRDGTRRLFHPVDAGRYVLSIQASGEHASIPASPVPATEVVAWEVAVFNGEGQLLDETVDPELLALPAEWLRYWRDGIARCVPSAVVRVLIHRFALGPDSFDRFVLEETDSD